MAAQCDSTVGNGSRMLYAVLLVSCICSAVGSGLGCAPRPELTIVIAAHVCDTRNANLLAATVSSAHELAPGARVFVVDSGSPRQLPPLRQPTRVVRTSDDGGQLAALRVAGALEPTFERLLLLQHSTPLSRCVPERPATGCCCAWRVGGHLKPQHHPLWRSDRLTRALLLTLEVREPWNWTVAEHCALDVQRRCWPTVAGLLARVRDSSVARAVRNGSVANGARELNRALEALCGVAAALANGWPRHASTCERQRLARKVHGGSYKGACAAATRAGLAERAGG